MPNSKQPSLELYHYWRSSCSWRVRWALNLKGLSYKDHAVDLRIDEQYATSYLKMNPSGSVPCLKVDQEYLSESGAIIEWLEEKFPQPALLPSDSWERARVREFCGIISSTQAVQNLKILKKHAGSDQSKRMEWAEHFISKGLEAYESKLRKYAGTFSFGATVTMADLFLIPQVYNAYRFKVDMSQFPLADSIYKKCLSTQACDQASPDKQIGASSSP